MNKWLNSMCVASILSATLLGALFMGSCTDTQEHFEPLPLGQAVVYRQQVHPYVSRRCGSLDCHGYSDRALRIYARHSLRAPGTPRNSGMTVREYNENIESFAAMSLPVSGKDFVLNKGLAIEAGGLAHEGGAIWHTPQEPGFRCLEAWLRGSQDPKACEIAVAMVDPDDDDDDDDDDDGDDDDF